MKRRCLSLIFAWLLSSGPAWAFCRATTCDPGDAAQHCELDSRTQCITSGSPVYWASSCITINVQHDGAPLAGISSDAAQTSVERALEAWLGADCSGKAPSLTVMLGEQVACSVPEYGKEHHNANVVMFREENWPYVGGEDALGITWLTFDEEISPGELFDADIEINAVTEKLSTGKPAEDEVDLDSLLTHEMGHFLGLAHTVEEDATMVAGYALGSSALRSLAEDDLAGICATYPPERQTSSSSCEPRHGFSSLCGDDQPPFVEPHSDPAEEPMEDPNGCALSAGRHASSGGAIAFGLLALLALPIRRRRR